MVSSYRHQIVR